MAIKNSPVTWSHQPRVQYHLIGRVLTQVGTKADTTAASDAEPFGYILSAILASLESMSRGRAVTPGLPTFVSIVLKLPSAKARAGSNLLYGPILTYRRP